MASQEHLQQMLDDDSDNGSSSTTSESSTDDEQQDVSTEEDQQDTSMEEGQQDVSMEEVSPSMPAKMRIKLSLRMPKSPEKSKAITSKVSTAPVAAKNEKGTTPAKQNDVTENAGSQDTTPSSKNNETTENGDVQDTTPSSRKDDDDTENDDDADGEEVVKATVVNSSDEGDGNDAEAVVRVEAVEPTTSAKSATSSVRSSAAPKKKSPPNKPLLPTHARAVRLPPLSSPGMLIPPTTGVYRGDADVNGFTTPASVFDHCMFLAGYTTEARTKNPHRGSSVRRQVGDMFDSNVSFTLHFPPLVPKEMWSLPKEDQEPSKDAKGEKKDEGAPMTRQEPSKDTTAEAQKKDEEPMERDAAKLLLRSLAPPGASKENSHTDSTAETSRKRRRPWQFADMVPLSLTLPYPESYIQKRLRYIEKVKERERAIVVSQEANEKYENANERYTLLSTAKRSSEELPPPPVPPEPTQIPPIPEPPSPPRLSELEGAEFDDMDESQHPIYLPKTHEKFTAHLDPTCFEITNGRYFNLSTNSIADPNFVGPNAPGIGGLNVSGGSGLATAYSSNISSGGSASALSAAYYGSVGGGSSSAAGSSKSTTGSKTTAKKKSSGTAAAKSAPDGGGHDDGAQGGPSPTSTSTGLKKMMDDGGDDANKMKNAIIRAAVYASRVGKHGMSFMGSNGEAYPDVSKAFAAHAGVRPCARCKNNKQGAYHCRLRRKHKDLDYDGGNSPAILAPLFEEPLEHLHLNNSSKIG